MNFLVLLSLVAFCVSTPIGVVKHVKLGDDGTISLTGPQGSQIDMYRSPVDQNKVELIFRSLHEPEILRIQVDEGTNIGDIHKYLDAPKGTITQGDLLYRIFSQHEGILNETSYQSLLTKIESLVQHGILRDVILKALQQLDRPNFVTELKEELVGKSSGNGVTWPAGVHLVHVSEDLPVRKAVESNILSHPDNYEFQQQLKKIQTLTPYQRYQLLLQTLKQLREFPENLEGQQWDQELLRPELMQQVHQQLKQEQMSPFNRFLFIRRMLNGQQQLLPYNQEQQVPQQWMHPQFYQLKSAPQQFRGLEQSHMLPQWTHQQPWNIYQEMPQQVPYLFEQRQMTPQQWNTVQDVPQALGMERDLFQQRQFIPQPYYQYQQEWTPSREVSEPIQGMNRVLSYDSLIPQQQWFKVPQEVQEVPLVY